MAPREEQNRDVELMHGIDVYTRRTKSEPSRFHEVPIVHSMN